MARKNSRQRGETASPGVPASVSAGPGGGSPINLIKVIFHEKNIFHIILISNFLKLRFKRKRGELSELEKRVVPEWRPHPSQEVRYKEAGGILEVTALSRINQVCNIRNLDKDHYVYIPTGEVFEKNHADTRAENVEVVRMSMGRLRDFINANVVPTIVNGKNTYPNVRWCTLTYKENMTDAARLYKDFEKFIKRFRYRYPGVEYIVAMEPQGRGAWHAHVFLIWPQEAPFIPNEEFSKIWKQGFVKIKALKDNDNPGVYFTAYLTDMELSDGVPEEALDGKHGIKNVNSKRFIKGARLHLYPAGFHLYRCSKGIKPPTVERVTEAEAMEKVGAATPTFERTIELSEPETGFSIVINKRYFNRYREKSQEGETHNDPKIGDGGIPDRPASAGEYISDPGLLPSVPGTLSSLCRPCCPGGDYAPPVQALLHPPDGEGHCLYDSANIYPGPACVPCLVLQRGLSDRGHHPALQAAQGPAQDHRRADG